MIDIARPRSPRSILSVAPVISWPLNIILPDVTRIVEANRPITAFAVTDLPEPDSPIMQRISPARSSKDTSSTA